MSYRWLTLHFSIRASDIIGLKIETKAPRFKVAYGKLPIKAIEQGEITMELLSDTLPFGLLELDAAGTVIRYSPAAEQSPHMLPEDILGRNFFTEVVPCEQVGQVKSRFLAFMAFGDAVQKFSIMCLVEQKNIKIQIMLARVTERGEHGRERLALVRIMPEWQSASTH